MTIIGRQYEQDELKRLYYSGQPELVAVYGRRRVGKTYLIREMFEHNFAFYFSGAVGDDVTNESQLANFDAAILEFGGSSEFASQNWSEAFLKLKKLLNKPKRERTVIFIDELPWLDLPNSGFLAAFDYFWNSFASNRSDIMLIVCGSASSWITKNLFENKGGLHGRITGRIHLMPFSLGECEMYLSFLGVVMTRYQILESYMVFGGIPYYLRLFVKGFGPSQNVDRLIFNNNAPLKNEYHELFYSLFSNAERHMKIIETLAAHPSGLTRDEIIEKSGIPGGGNLTVALTELIQCAFIEKYADFTKPKNGSYYRLIDNFSFFWYRFVKNNETKDEYYWTNRIDDGARRAWTGYAFEQICIQHISQIKRKLGISGVSTEVFSWRSKVKKAGAQIDLIISRKDGVLNLCEMKFVLHPITINKTIAEELLNKRAVFVQETGTNLAVHLTMVTTYGLTMEGYRGSVQSEVNMDDLFQL